MKVRTQAELNAALKAGETLIELHGDGYFEVGGSATVTAYDSATVTAYGSATVTAYGSATVRAYDSATVRAYDSATVTAYGSATVRAYDSATVRAYDSATVTASGSATVRASGSATVTAYDSATVTAYGSATVTASGSATVRATPCVPVQDHGPNTRITGGVVIPIRTPETMIEWCSFYGVKVARGWAIVFKAVDSDLTSAHGTAYPIGEEVGCPDWSDVKACGNGLHFSPRPFMAIAYAPNATRFLAVRVKVSECVVLGDKVKAPRGKVDAEVNEDGDPIGSAA